MKRMNVLLALGIMVIAGITAYLALNKPLKAPKPTCPYKVTQYTVEVPGQPVKTVTLTYETTGKKRVLTEDASSGNNPHEITTYTYSASTVTKTSPGGTIIYNLNNQGLAISDNTGNTNEYDNTKHLIKQTTRNAQGATLWVMTRAWGTGTNTDRIESESFDFGLNDSRNHKFVYSYDTPAKQDCNDLGLYYFGVTNAFFRIKQEDFPEGATTPSQGWMFEYQADVNNYYYKQTMKASDGTVLYTITYLYQ